MVSAVHSNTNREHKQSTKIRQFCTQRLGSHTLSKRIRQFAKNASARIKLEMRYLVRLTHRSESSTSQRHACDRSTIANLERVTHRSDKACCYVARKNLGSTEICNSHMQLQHRYFFRKERREQGLDTNERNSIKSPSFDFTSFRGIEHHLDYGQPPYM